MEIKNKVVLLTGASKGIGLELSKQLQNEGAILILIGRNFKDRKLGKNNLYIVADLSTYEGMKKIGKLIEGRDIDILINMAGIGVYKSLSELSVNDLENSLKINLIVPFELIKLVKDKLASSDTGLVLNIGSGAGTMPFKNRSVYCATKYALRGLSLSLSEEYKGRKPKFCLITLGSTMTTFGGKTIEEQKKKVAEGNGIFPVEYVAKEIIKVIKNEERENEIILYPSDFGFGKWKKP